MSFLSRTLCHNEMDVVSSGLCFFFSSRIVWWSLYASFSYVIVTLVTPAYRCACCGQLAMFVFMFSASTIVKTSIHMAWGI